MTESSPFCCIELSGDHALKTLHGQSTQDLLSQASDQAPLTAFLNPKGRMLATARVFQDREKVYLITAADTADLLIEKLKPMCMLARVTIERSALSAVLTGPATTALPPGSIETHDTFWHIGEHGHTEWVVGHRTPSHQVSADIARLNAGFAMIHHAASDLLIPQQAHYQMLGGVSFTKGCYTGQEIVARLEHLGQTKKYLKIAPIETPIAIGEILAIEGHSLPVVDVGFEKDQGVALVLSPVELTSEQLLDPPFEIVRQVAGHRPGKG